MNVWSRVIDRVLGVERFGTLRALAFGLAEHRLQPLPPLNLFPDAEYVSLHEGNVVDTTDVPRIGDVDFPFPLVPGVPTRTPDTGVWQLRGARWWSGVGAVTDGSRFVEGCLRYPVKYAPVKHTRWLDYPVQRVAGVCMGLEGDFGGTHYHQLLDLGPRVALLRHPYFRQFDRITLLSARYRHSPQLRYLVDNLLPSNVHVLETQPDVLVEADTLLMPVGVMDTWLSIPNKWYIDELRAVWAPDRSSRPTRRIYISRAKARARTLLNEDDAVAGLDKLDFEVVRTEQFDLAQVIRLMSESEIVVSLLGSGLANIIFCSPPTAVVEIASAASWSIDYYAIAKSCELQFATVAAEPRASNVPRWHGHRDRMMASPYYRRRDADLVVDVDALTCAVADLLNGRVHA